MQKFTCLTCRVSLNSAECQRDHYKSEWHIYNLKRKLNQLAPLTEEDYRQVLLRHSLENCTDKVDESFYCDRCCKIFYTKQAFNQHNSSKKHLHLLTTNKKNKKPIDKVDDDSKIELQKVDTIVDGNADDFNESDWEEIDEDEEVLESVPLNECLFCSESSENMETNLLHMSKSHSFFIPDVEFCVDLKGLLNYVGIKIASGFCCLFCSEFGKQFASKKSAQQHMIDKGHTKIKFDHSNDLFLEFEDFYDYSSSYPTNGEANDEINLDEFNLDGDEYQLRLPSGSVIGHRSLFAYYKQNLRPQPVEKKSKNKELLNKVMSQYKALGWTGITNKEAVQKAKDIGYMHRIKQKQQLKLGKHNNVNMQPHFRSQIGFN